MPDNSDHAPFVYDIYQDEGEFGLAMLCYGSGSSNTTHTWTIWTGSTKKAWRYLGLYTDL